MPAGSGDVGHHPHKAGGRLLFARGLADPSRLHPREAGCANLPASALSKLDFGVGWLGSSEASP